MWAVQKAGAECVRATPCVQLMDWNRDGKERQRAAHVRMGRAGWGSGLNTMSVCYPHFTDEEAGSNKVEQNTSPGKKVLGSDSWLLDS